MEALKASLAAGKGGRRSSTARAEPARVQRTAARAARRPATAARRKKAG
jgi:hypothetical protein